MDYLSHIPAITFDIAPFPASTPFLHVVTVLDGYLAAETTFWPGSVDSCVVALDVAAAAQRRSMGEGVAALHVARAVIVIAVRLERDIIDLLVTAQRELADTAAMGIVRDPDPADAGGMLRAAIREIRASDDPMDPAILVPVMEQALLDHAATRITIPPTAAPPRFWPCRGLRRFSLMQWGGAWDVMGGGDDGGMSSPPLVAPFFARCAGCRQVTRTTVDLGLVLPLVECACAWCGQRVSYPISQIAGRP